MASRPPTGGERNATELSSAWIQLSWRVVRDVEAVHGDVHALLAAGRVERTDDGCVVFPYDAVRVAFELLRA